MAFEGELYTALECDLDIQKHAILEKIHGLKYKEVIQNANGLLYQPITG